LAAYADRGSSLPGMPRFERPARDGGLSGDATGFYAAAREFMAAWGRMPRPVLALDALLAIAATIAIVVLWRSRPAWRPWLAAAFWTAWPLLVGVIAGHQAWTNGQWDVDVGLHNYSEPLSTLLVTAAAALLLSPRMTQLRLAVAGCALSAATLVKLSNALLAAAALALVFLRGRTREALPYLAGALSLAPLVAVYWPLSYPKLFDNPQSWPR